MAFDLSSVLSGVPNLGTERKQIEYISLDLIDPDPSNFYSLDGLDELAGNIELIGLQQPLLVRSGENGRFTVVSGHRRRAAIMLIRDGGSDMFKDGVPCIREIGECSDALKELQLIYANASTRVLSAAEISKQIERVQELLYELKEQGVDFPGRMRDHVAEACRISKSKLSRLHAIRSNLKSGLLEKFDSGELPESAAYELQKLPEEVQQAIYDAADSKKGFKQILGGCAGRCVENADIYMAEAACPDGTQCEHHVPRFVKTALSPYGYEYCPGTCCLSCYKRSDCKQACQKAKDKLKEDKALAAQQKDKAAAEEEKRQTTYRRAVQKEAERLMPLIEAAKLNDSEYIPGTGYTIGAVREYSRGVFPEYKTFDSKKPFLPWVTSEVIKFAKKLDCSADFILGLSDEPRPVPNLGTKPVWNEGKPDYDCLVTGRFDCGGVIIKSVVRYDAFLQKFCFESTKQPLDAECVGWVELPEEE